MPPCPAPAFDIRTGKSYARGAGPREDRKNRVFLCRLPCSRSKSLAFLSFDILRPCRFSQSRRSKWEGNARGAMSMTTGSCNTNFDCSIGVQCPRWRAIFPNGEKLVPRRGMLPEIFAGATIRCQENLCYNKSPIIHASFLLSPVPLHAEFESRRVFVGSCKDTTALSLGSSTAECVATNVLGIAMGNPKEKEQQRLAEAKACVLPWCQPQRTHARRTPSLLHSPGVGPWLLAWRASACY